MKTTKRSATQVEPGATIEYLSTEWIVLSCRRALPGLHYNGYILSLIEEAQ